MNNNYLVSKILGTTKYFILFLFLIGFFFASGVGVAFFLARNNEKPAIIPSQAILTDGSLEVGSSANQKLTVNAQLEVNGQFYLAPTEVPQDAKPGTLIFDKNTSTLQYFDGGSFVPLKAQTPVQNGVTSLQGQTGVVSLSPGRGISINGTVINSSGILGVNGVSGDVSVTTANGVATISLPQPIAPSSIPTFAGLNLSNALTVPYGGTGSSSFGVNSVVIGNGTGALSSITAPAAGQCLVSTAGAPMFGTCSGGGVGVASFNGLTGNLTLSNASGIGSVINIDDASTLQKGIAQFDGNNFTVTAGIVDTIQNINTTATPTFTGISLTNLNVNGDTVNDITGSGLIVVGNALQSTLGNSVDLSSEVSGILATSSGGTGRSALTSNGVLFGNGSSAINSTVAGTTGQCLVATTGSAPAWASCPGASGVSSFSLAGSSGVVQTITDSNILTIAAGSNIDTTAGAVDTVTVAVSSSPTFSGLITANGGLTVETGDAFGLNGDSFSDLTGTGLTISGGSLQTTLGTSVALNSAEVTGVLPVANGGIGIGSLTSNSVIVGNGAGIPQQITAGGAGLCFMSTAGTPAFSACPGSGGVTSLNSQAGILTLANATASSGTITINDASTAQKGIAQFNGTNFSVSAGTVNTIQGISSSATPTFAGLTLSAPLAVASGGTGANNASDARSNLGAAASGANSDISSTGVLNTITPSAALTIGTSAHSFSLQGTSASTVSATNGAFTTTLGFTTPTANVAINLPALGAGTYDICTSSGNCLGGGAGGANTALNNLSSVAINTSLLSGSSTIDLGSGTNPFRDLYLGGATTNNFQITGTATAARTITLPDASGDVCLSSGNCIGGGGGGAPSTSSYLTLGLDGALSSERVLNAGTNISFNDSGANGNLTVATVANPTFGTSVTTPLLTSSGALQVSSAGNLTLGTTSQQVLVQGSGSSTIEITNASNKTTVGFATPTASTTISFPALTAGSYSVCTSAGNCSSGGVSSLNTFTGAVTVQGTSNQIIVDNTAGVITLSTPQDINTNSNPTFNNLTVASLIVGGDTIDEFVGTGLAIVSGELQTVLGTSIDLTSEVTGTLPVASGGTGATTIQGAINSLSGLTTNGDLLYHNGTNATRLARGTDTQCLLSSTTTILWGTCTGGDILQNGNSLGQAVTVGTNDNFGLNFEVNNTNVASLSNTGSALFKNSTNSALGFNVQSSGGVDIFKIDTVYQRVAIGTAAPTAKLTVTDFQTSNSGIIAVQQITSGFAPTLTNYSTGSDGLRVLSQLNASTAVDSSHVDAYVRGVYAEAPNLSGQTIYATYGVTGASGIGTGASGDVTNAYGTQGYVYQNGTGEITNAFPVFSEVRSTGSGTIQNAVGFYGDLSRTAGSINQYTLLKSGDYSSIVGAANQYGVLTYGKSRFGDNTLPTEVLEVAGNIAVDAANSYKIGTTIAVEASGGYLRLNQANQFSNGILTGSSGIRVGGTTGVLVGSTGVDGQIALIPSGVDTTRRITLSGGTGNIQNTGSLTSGTGNNRIYLGDSGDGIVKAKIFDANHVTGNPEYRLFENGTQRAKFYYDITANRFVLQNTENNNNDAIYIAENLSVERSAFIQGGSVTLGGASQSGILVLSDGSSNYGSIALASTSGDYTYTIPTTTANDTFCLATLANCGGGGAGDVLQGGNSFGSAMVLGTNDSNSLSFETGGTTFFTLSTSGLLQAANGGKISAPSTGTNSEAFGAGAVAAGNSTLAIGYNAVTNTESSSIAIGANSSAGNWGGGSVSIGTSASSARSGVAIGNNASNNGRYETAIGAGATTSGSTNSGAIAIGNDANASNARSIVIGTYASSTANGQLVIGSNDVTLGRLTEGYFGSGVTAASPLDFTFNATGGSGTNVAGADLGIAAGRGTGSAAGGGLNFQTSAAGASGTTLRNLSTVFSLQGGTGQAVFQNTSNSTTALRVNNAAGTSVFNVNTSTPSVGISGATAVGGTNGWLQVGDGSLSSGHTALIVDNGSVNSNIASFTDNGTEVFGIANNGLFLFKNAADSATSLRVQTAAGANILTVNTLTPGLVVGGTVQYNAGSANTADSVCRNSTGQLAGCTSSSRYKDNVSNLSLGLAELNRLQPVTYNWNTTGKADVGFIAEQVATVIPQAVTYDENGEVASFNYNTVTALLVSSVKQIDLKVRAIETRLAKVEQGDFAGNIKVGGKIISLGDKPDVLAYSTVVNETTVSVTGTDVAATVSLQTGSEEVPDDLTVKISFTKPYSGGTPIANISPVGKLSADLGMYIVSVNNNEMVIGFTVKPDTNKTYKFNYQIIQANNPN